jgi:hypothetical protein
MAGREATLVVLVLFLMDLVRGMFGEYSKTFAHLLPAPPSDPRIMDKLAESDSLSMDDSSSQLQALRLDAGPGAPRADAGLDASPLVDCCQPVLSNIASFACGSADDLTRLTSQIAKPITAVLESERNGLWKNVFRRRWPAFHDFFEFQGAQDWDKTYQDTRAGRAEALLEVFDREKKPGFAMAAVIAQVAYEESTDCYVARYVTSREVPPESIPQCEAHRLRCCPAAVRARLEPRPLPARPGDALEVPKAPRGPAIPPSEDHYPHRVLEGFAGLRPGAGVELQLKMQYAIPFGWWYGHLYALDIDEDGALATATITFRHFPSNSRMYMLKVRFGDNLMRPCALGGFTGGIRPITEAEQKHWMNFFPRKAAGR